MHPLPPDLAVSEQAQEETFEIWERGRFPPFFRMGRTATLATACLIITGVALIDWRSADDIPLGFLYLFPMLMLGRLLKRWQILLPAALCTYLAEVFDPFSWNMRTGLPRDFLYFIAFLAIGVFVHQVNLNRETMMKYVRLIETQSAGRLEAEQQLTLLIESNPAAIVTTDTKGFIQMANEAAHRLFGAKPTTLLNTSIYPLLPTLLHVTRRDPSQHLLRTVMQVRGHRCDGETFLAEVCFSTYKTTVGVRLTAMILDTSEEFRSREESTLHQMLAGSRLAVNAVSHEVRNVCGAIAAVHQNLARTNKLSADSDFEALGNLVIALERIAAVDLKPYSDQSAEVDVGALLEDLRIVISPALKESGIRLTLQLEQGLPSVRADGTHLMQVMLNLTSNSIRALESTAVEPTLTIKVEARESYVEVEVRDNGGGISNTVDLFRPFQAGAQNTGLGLYLARAFARSFGGDLQYRAVPDGSCFTVSLLTTRESL